MTLPQYTLLDFMGWQTTRYIPLPQYACNAILNIVNNTVGFEEMIPQVAGLEANNTVAFTPSLNNLWYTENFQELATQIIVPWSLFTYLEMEMNNNHSALLTDSMITMLMTVVNMTPEFSPFLSQLSGITPENSREYLNVINTLITFPLFRINAQQFLIDDAN